MTDYKYRDYEVIHVSASFPVTLPDGIDLFLMTDHEDQK